MLRTALRDVLAHRARLMMTVLAVMLGVAFVSGTLVFTSTVSEAYRTSSQKSFDHVDVAIRPGRPDPDAAPGAEPRLTRELLDRLAVLPGVRSATGVVSGFTAVAGGDGGPLGARWSTRGTNHVPGADGRDARYPMREGRAPRGRAEIALDAGTAARAGFHVGDTVRVSVDGPVMEPRLTGVFTTDDGEVAAGGSLVLFDTATAQRLFGMRDEFTEIDLAAAPGVSQSALRTAVDRLLPEEFWPMTGASLAGEQALRTEAATSSLRSTLLVFAGIALFVGAFLIANTFTMLLAQRTDQLALLRAVGATSRQVTRSVLIEAGVVGLVASSGGLAAGIGLGAALRPLTTAFGKGAGILPDGPLVITPATVITSFAVGVGVTLVAAWWPARRAARIPPVAAMGSAHATPATRTLVVRNGLGALLTALGITVVLAATGMHTDDGRLVMSLGGILLVTGVLVLTPLLSRPFLAVAAPALRVFGVTGRIACRNAGRDPRRTASTASALTIGLALITGLTVIAVSSQRETDQRATAALSADYVVRMAGYEPLSATVEKRLARVGGVSATSPLREAPARVAGHDTYLTGVDAASIGRLVRPDFTEGSLTGFSGSRALVPNDLAEEYGWRTGTTVPVTYPDGEQGTLTVSGVYRADDLLQGVVTDIRTLDPHLRSLGSRQVLVKIDGGAGEGTARKLTAALDGSPAVLVQSRAEVSASIARGVTMMLNILYGLLAMAVVIAVLGVVNTLAMSVVERAREIGMLRAVGLDRGGVTRMVCLESVTISLFGGVLGVCLGVFLGWAGGRLLADDLPGFQLVVPFGRLTLFLLLAAATGLLGALWPAHRAGELRETPAP